MAALPNQAYANLDNPYWLKNPVPYLEISGTPSVTLTNNDGVLEVNGVPVTGEPVSNWYEYPTANRIILFGTDPNTQDVLQAVDRFLYFNGEILAQAGDISNVADWYLYPALGDVNLNGNGISNLTDINGCNISNYEARYWSAYSALCNVNMNGNVICNAVGISNLTGSNLVVASDAGLTLSGDNFVVISNNETNPAFSSSVLVEAKGGTGGTLNLRADKGIATGGAVVNVEALAGDIAGYGWGGTVNITAYSAPSVGATSKVSISAAGVNSYAGAVPPIASLAGYNFIYGQGGVNVCAGLPPIFPNVPLTTYVYGTAGVTLEAGLAGDVQVKDSIFGATYIKPYYSALAPVSNLFITGRSNLVLANQYVTLTMVNNIDFENLAFITGLKSLTMSNGVICNVSNINLSNINGAPYIPGSNWSAYPATTNVDMCNFSICNVSNINGVPYASGAAWASYPAIGNVDMCNFSISNLSNVNGVAYSPTCNWASFIASSSVNMNGCNISNVGTINGVTIDAVSNWAVYNAVSNVKVLSNEVEFNTKRIREGAGYLNGATTSVEMYTPVTVAATARAASVVFSKVSGGVVDYTGDTLLYAFNAANPARLLTQSTYGTETVAYISDVAYRPTYDLYVAVNGSDVTGNGSSGTPYQTIGAAITARAGISSAVMTTIHLRSGTYTENITLATNTSLVGETGTSDPAADPVVIVGNVSAAATNVGIYGLTVTGTCSLTGAGNAYALNNVTVNSSGTFCVSGNSTCSITSCRLTNTGGGCINVTLNGLFSVRDSVLTISSAGANVVQATGAIDIIRSSVESTSAASTVPALVRFLNSGTVSTNIRFTRLNYTSTVTDTGGNKCCIQYAGAGTNNSQVSQCVMECVGAVTGGNRIECIQKTGAGAVNLVYGGIETVAPASFISTGVTRTPMDLVDEGVYGCFSSSITTTVTAANTPTTLNHNIVEVNSGVLSISGGNINLNRAGNYEVSTSIQLSKTDAGTDFVYFWFRINGTDVTRSASSIRMKGSDSEVLGNVTAMISANAGDVLSVVIGSADATVRALAVGAQSSPMVVPAIPSVITSVKLLN